MKSSDAEIGPQILGSLSKGDLGQYLLVPGDPDRVATLAAVWDDAEEIPLERGFRLARGLFREKAAGNDLRSQYLSPTCRRTVWDKRLTGGVGAKPPGGRSAIG